MFPRSDEHYGRYYWFILHQFMLPDHSIIVIKVEARPQITMIWKFQVCNTNWLKSQVSKVHEQMCDFSVLVLFVCFPIFPLKCSLYLTIYHIFLYQNLQILYLFLVIPIIRYLSGVWTNIDR